jgi:hypothetical protein
MKRHISAIWVSILIGAAAVFVNPIYAQINDSDWQEGSVSVMQGSYQTTPYSETQQQFVPGVQQVVATGQQFAPAVQYNFLTGSTIHFDLYSDSGEAELNLLAEEMEQRFEVYNRIFRFSPSYTLGVRLVVRSFSNKAAFDTYIATKGTNPAKALPEGAVYLHYTDPSRRELVIDRSSANLDWMLPHQAFIQYFRAFIPNPPDWMREGFAIYFNSLRFNKQTLQLDFEENLSWLETVQNLGPSMPSLDTILLADSTTGYPAMFQPVSWALVSYFLNGNANNPYSLADNRRTLTDTFLILSPIQNSKENAAAVKSRIEAWVNLANLTKDFDLYIHSRKTYAMLVDTGSKAYTAHDYAAAEAYFVDAANVKPSHPAAYYYLGLLAFENGDSGAAEYYYTTSLSLGANAALVCYALGVLYARDGRNDEAVYYLEQSISFDSARYGEKAQIMIQRLR